MGATINAAAAKKKRRSRKQQKGANPDMAGRWKPPKEQRTDAEAMRRKRELAEKLSDALDYGTEEDFVAAVKSFKPEIGKTELKAWIMRFRAALREKRGLC